MVAIYAPRQRQDHGADPDADPVGGAELAAPSGLPPARRTMGERALPGDAPSRGPGQTGDGFDARPATVPRTPGSSDMRWRLPDRATRLRRRRLAALVAAVIVVVAIVGAVRVAVALSGVPQSTGPEPIDVGPVSEASTVYIVQPGDTLWSIAEAIAPDSDPRPVVDALRDANGGPTLHPGDRLRIDVEG
jgi:nucleoid-associated protein YgaU